MINISVYTYTTHNINTQPISRKNGGLRLHYIEYQQLFWSPAQHTLEITQSLNAPFIIYNWYHSPYDHPLHHTRLNSLNLSPFLLQHIFKNTQPLSVEYTIHYINQSSYRCPMCHRQFNSLNLSVSPSQHTSKTTQCHGVSFTISTNTT